MKEFLLEELTQFDGNEGRPVHIVHENRVFDVTESKLWKGGLHMRRHHAGRDLTVDIKAAPHGTEVLQRYPQVGVVKEEIAETSLGDEGKHSVLLQLLDRYPMLRRHPHPMTVHFPIVFMISTTVFNLLYLLTGNKSFEIVALFSLGSGVLFIPLVILTGLLSWWLNYMARPLHPVQVKLGASLILFGVSLVAFTWRIAEPDIMCSFGLRMAIYLLLVLSLAPLVGIIGWFGAKLTFPVEGS